MEFLVVIEPVKYLLLGLVANGAGVVEDQVGVRFRLDLTVTLLLQCANNLFGVMGIHLAAEGLKIEGFFGRHGNLEYTVTGTVPSERIPGQPGPQRRLVCR